MSKAFRKVKNSYVCGLCGSTYNSYSDMENCISKHRSIVAIKGAQYYKDEKLPRKVNITFSDGSCVVYSKG